MGVAHDLAAATGRPVRMISDYIEEFMAGNPRHATRTRLKTGVMRDGTIVALRVAASAGVSCVRRVQMMSSELSSRLAREERAARGSMELARQQAQLNRLVIEEMADGVLVAVSTAARAADRDRRLRAVRSAPDRPS